MNHEILIRELKKEIAEKDLKILKLKNIISGVISNAQSYQEYIKSVQELYELY